MDTKFKDMLSTRSKNGLTRLYGKDILNEPETIAWLGKVGVLKQALGLGPKTLQEIAFNLCKYGFIKNTEKWLKG
jgi:hypothetical protein